MSGHLGYIYIHPPSGVNGASTLYKWEFNPRIDPVLAVREDLYIKMAFVTEDEDMSFRLPVYADVRTHPDISHDDFIIPTGWTQVGMYTDVDLIVRKVIRRGSICDTGVIGPAIGTAVSSSSSLFRNEDFLSPLRPLSAAGWPLDLASESFATSSSVSEPTSATQLSSYGGPLPLPIDVSGSGSLHIFPMAKGASRTTEDGYVICSSDFFSEGIKYDAKYLETHFPAFYSSILDAKLLAKNYMVIHSQYNHENFVAFCKQKLVEMFTATSPLVERGLWCRETMRTSQLNVGCKQVIGLVLAEYKSYTQAMKRWTVAIFENEKKSTSCDGYYYMFKMTDEEVGEHIRHLTNLTTWDGEVTSIEFTRDKEGRPYRRKAILTVLAQKLLRATRGQNSQESLLTLFHEDYDAIPDHLMADTCAYFAAMFRCYLKALADGGKIRPGNTPVTLEDLSKEQLHQLKLFREFREQPTAEAEELNLWITTRDRWLNDLQSELVISNKQRGPTPRKRVQRN